MILLLLWITLMLNSPLLQWFIKVMWHTQRKYVTHDYLTPLRKPFSEDSRASANQEVPRLIHNPKVHYRVHKRLTQVPVLCLNSQVQTQKHIFFRSILLLSSHLSLGVINGPHPDYSPTDFMKIMHVSTLLCVLHVSTISSFFTLSLLILFCEECKH
jgi:hypothetical protein